jgi:uncharacterized membrane protein YbhN (UPF0104 family)
LAQKLANFYDRLWVMFAITGLMYGSQYFQSNDAPFYQRGLSITIGVMSAGLVIVGLQEAIYFLHNRKVVNQKEEVQHRKILYTL